VLIEEWSPWPASPPSSVPHARRKLLRAWMRDANGVRAITLEEHKQHKRTIHGRIYPFVIMSFQIESDRRRVEIGHQHANTAGYGRTYLVRGEGAGATLEVDPTGAQWIS
jgi:hypothetical protein